MKESCELLFVCDHVAVRVRRSETSLVPPHHVTVVILGVHLGAVCEREPIKRLIRGLSRESISVSIRQLINVSAVLGVTGYKVTY